MGKVRTKKDGKKKKRAFFIEAHIRKTKNTSGLLGVRTKPKANYYPA